MAPVDCVAVVADAVTAGVRVVGGGGQIVSEVEVAPVADADAVAGVGPNVIAAVVAGGASVSVIVVDAAAATDLSRDDGAHADDADLEAYDTAAAVVDWASDVVGGAAGWAALDSGVVVGVGGA